jgi:hypothetical protein
MSDASEVRVLVATEAQIRDYIEQCQEAGTQHGPKLSKKEFYAQAQERAFKQVLQYIQHARMKEDENPPEEDLLDALGGIKFNGL